MNSPIFIVGAPRSGTTLMRNMLNRHPAIAISRETEFYHYIYRRRRIFGSLSDLGNRKRLVKEYLSTQRIQRMNSDPRDVVASLLRMPSAPNDVIGNARVWLRFNLAARRSRSAMNSS